MHAENAHKTNKLQLESKADKHIRTTQIMFVCLFVEILYLGSSSNT